MAVHYFRSSFLQPLQNFELEVAKANPYQYERLPESRAFRLLELPTLPGRPCSVLTTGIDRAPPYAALSYTWDSPIRDVMENEYKDQSFPLAIRTSAGNRWIIITRNLYEAMLAVTRAKGTRYLWNDAVCINQMDDGEKNVQIPLMGDIYSRCQKVIVWLGDDQSHLDAMINIHHRSLGPELVKYAVLHGADSIYASDWSVDSVMTTLGVQVENKTWESYVAFYEQRRWFSRAWIVQELALAPVIQVLCGWSSLDWGGMTAVGMFLMHSLGVKLQPLRNLRPSQSLGHEIHVLQALRADCGNGGPTADQSHFSSRATFVERTGAHTERQLQYAFLEHCLQQVRTFEATKAHDKVYAVLGMFRKFSTGELDELIIPDYQLPVAEVYTRVTWLLLRELPFLSTLSSVEGSFVPTQRATLGLPSWVPDYNVLVTDNSLPNLLGKSGLNASLTDPRNPNYRARHGNELYLEGVAYDYISGAADVWDVSELEGEEDRSRMMLEALATLLALCFDPPLNCQGDETPYDAVYLTLIAGMTHLPPKPTLPRTHFRDYILLLLARAKFQGESRHPSFEKCIEYLTRFAQQGITDFPTRQDIERTTEALAGGGGDGIIRGLESGFHEFTARVGMMALNRCVYKTTRGHLGLGPACLCLGDEVWLIRGATVLFVLRQAAEEGKFTLVGDAYLHGFMNGEILESDVRDQVGQLTLI